MPLCYFNHFLQLWENTFNMTRQRGGKPILAASHIRRHSLVNLEAEQLFWIWVIFFDICATVPGFKAGINVCLILSKSQGNLNHQHSAGSLVSGFAGTWKYVPDRGPTPKTGKFLLLVQAKSWCFGFKIVSTENNLDCDLALVFQGSNLDQEQLLGGGQEGFGEGFGREAAAPSFLMKCNWSYDSMSCESSYYF